MGRAPCCDKANVKRGPWSPEEDAILKSYVELHGTGGNWIALPQKAGLKRCGKSCRLRWLNYLRPDIKHGGFTEEEDTVIFSLYNKIGSRWSVIASKLPGRTDNDVKNYWNTKLKKKVMGGQISPTTTTTSPTPPPPSLAATIKAEGYNGGDAFWMPPAEFLDHTYGFTHESQKVYYTEFAPPPPPPPQPMVVSPSEEVSMASSSTVTVENSSSTSYINDAFFSEFGFPSNYGSQESMGEFPPYFYSSNLANMWAASEVKPQGLFQSLTHL
ncbi:uncharacterized protein [Typha latifolia]|uniref:uncharacterized protein n=1 Tax=Typha latifolia TaxID=4733 RepID=UPI003C30BB97